MKGCRQGFYYGVIGRRQSHQDGANYLLAGSPWALGLFDMEEDTAFQAGGSQYGDVSDGLVFGSRLLTS